MPDKYAEFCGKFGLTPGETDSWRYMAENTYIPFDEATGLYEQHDGFFNLPHIDIHSIPVEEFPLYHNWSYDRIYRYDMIKQPDVLMFMFLYNTQFSERGKRANYEFYEPRCIHESSLSPSIHSIFASELEKQSGLCIGRPRSCLGILPKGAGTGLRQNTGKKLQPVEKEMVGIRYKDR